MHGSAFLKPIQNILNEISKSKPKEFAEVLYDRIKSIQANPPPKSDTIYFNQSDVQCVQCARDREIYILVVKFDHKKGSVIEYIIPNEAQQKFVQGTDIEKSIVFSALPDAAHTSEVFFFSE
jgi:hypothetical protein